MVIKLFLQSRDPTVDEDVRAQLEAQFKKMQEQEAAKETEKVKYMKSYVIESHKE